MMNAGLKPIEQAAKQHEWVFLDNQIVHVLEAGIPITTQAFNYGTGVFEGIRAYRSDDGKKLNIFRLDEHIKRLKNSAKFLKLEALPSSKEIKRIIIDLLNKNQASGDTYIRPMAYKKSLLPGVEFGVRLSGVSSGFSVNTLPMGSYLRKSGIRCTISDWRRTPDSSMPTRAKITGNYVNSALAMETAISSGFDDALLLNIHGNLAESTTANVFIVKNRTLITPPIGAHILEGITRDTVIQIARKELGLKVIERNISQSELFDVDECFLTGTGVEITPVIQIDHLTVNDGEPGIITKQLRSEYLSSVRGGSINHLHWLTEVY